MESATTRRREVTDEELREAEKGLVRLLHKKRFPREWIERNVPDVMAMARTDFAARLAAGKEDETVNLLVVIGYRRAVKVLDAQLSGPSTTSLDSVFQLADESTPTPEEEAIDHDRQERVVKAMAHLPERERKLMAFVYFDGKSIRDAGRRLGWGKSSADRHHQAALEKLHELLDRSLLSPEIPIPAYIVARHWQNSPLRAAERWVQGAGETVADGLMLGSGRVGQAAEGASAAATSGAGRTAAGVCGAAIAVCLTGAATGVVGPGVGAVGLGQEAPGPAPKHRAASREAAAEVQSGTTPILPDRAATAEPDTAARSIARQPGAGGGSPTVTAGREPEARERRSGSAPSAPAATPKEVVNEFGVEGGGESESSGESAPAPSPAPAPSRPAAESPSSGSGSSGSSGASSTGSEFGM